MTAAAPGYCAIDFGTSNSAIAIAAPFPASGSAAAAMRLVELEPGQRTMPTAVFYAADGGLHGVGLGGDLEPRLARGLQHLDARQHEPRRPQREERGARGQRQPRPAQAIAGERAHRVGEGVRHATTRAQLTRNPAPPGTPPPPPHRR